MAAEGGNNITWFTYTGEDGEIIPHDATHIFVDAKLIPASAFYNHPNIVEVICHDRVEKIETQAFCECPGLRRVIMRGVKTAEYEAFYWCRALEEVECDELEIIGDRAFHYCISLRSINLPSARIVEFEAFDYCESLATAKFSSKMERLEEHAFGNCPSLVLITIPLKNRLITHDNVFMGCKSLSHVDLVEGAELLETVAALHLEDWRNYMNEEITSITQILPNASAGGWDYDIDDDDEGEQAQVIRGWIRSVLRKMVHYKAEHQRILDEAATTLQQVLPQDLVMNNVLSFLELPSHTFGVDDHQDDGEEDDSDGER